MQSAGGRTDRRCRGGGVFGLVRAGSGRGNGHLRDSALYCFGACPHRPQHAGGFPPGTNLIFLTLTAPLGRCVIEAGKTLRIWCTE